MIMKFAYLWLYSLHFYTQYIANWRVTSILQIKTLPRESRGKFSYNVRHFIQIVTCTPVFECCITYKIFICSSNEIIKIIKRNYLPVTRVEFAAMLRWI